MIYESTNDAGAERPEKGLSIRGQIFQKIIFLLAAVLCLTTLITPPIALLMGLIIGQFVGHPYLDQS